MAQNTYTRSTLGLVRAGFSNPTLVYITLSVILIFGFTLRVHHLDTYGIFLDEKYTMVISQGIVMDGANQKDVFSKPTFTPQEFWKTKTLDDFFEAITRGDIGNSPVYYAIVHTWMNIFGISDYSARFPSVLFSTGIILLLFLFVMRFYRSPELALISAFIVAVEPFFIGYSHQARNYSLSFFLTLLATYVFLSILEGNRRNRWALFLTYGLLTGLCLLSHFLTFTVFIGHGMYILLFNRDFRLWAKLVGAIGLGISMMAAWMTYGGGKYTLFTLDYQAKLYRKMALTMPTTNPFGEILPATFTNVLKKSIPMFSDLFIFTNGLHGVLVGKKQILLATLIGLIVVLIYHFRHRAPFLQRYYWLLGSLLIVCSLVVYQSNTLAFGTLSASVFLFYLIGRYFTQVQPSKKSLYWFLVIMALTPNVFLVIWAFRNGHTYGLTQRYGGFCFPFSVMLVAIAFRQLITLRSRLSLAIGLFLVYQAIAVCKLLVAIYEDRSPKYGYFAKPRGKNPYYLTAQKIKIAYEIGDTVKYPTEKMVFLSDIDRTHFNYSLKDAQLTNLYLPKDATYIQQIDTTELNKVVLVKAQTGEHITLFDFQGTTHRY